MASLFKQNDGGWRIEFTTAKNGPRRHVRLGQVARNDASTALTWIEKLITAKAMAASIDPETARWVSTVSDALHERLARAGLVAPRAQASGMSIGAFIDKFLQQHPEYKPFTVTNMMQARRRLTQFFGDNRDMQTITNNDAEDFRMNMVDAGLAEATYRRCLGRCRQLFKAAIKRGIIKGENPFADMAVTVRADKARQFFVSRECANKLIAAAPNAQWRAMIALSRYGGIRTPSETLALRWGDVDFERSRIRIPSPKTERHEGRDCRYIPMFPELRKPLMDCFEQAEPGEEHIITRYRSVSQNLRTQLLRIADRAGVTPWPKLWHNMRASRQTELAESYPIHVVCEWIGNSRAVAQEHYLTVTDAHYERAIASPDNSAVKSAAAQPGLPVHGHEANCETSNISQAFTTMHDNTYMDMPGAGLEPARPKTVTGF